MHAGLQRRGCRLRCWRIVPARSGQRERPQRGGHDSNHIEALMRSGGTRIDVSSPYLYPGPRSRVDAVPPAWRGAAPADSHQHRHCVHRLPFGAHWYATYRVSLLKLAWNSVRECGQTLAKAHALPPLPTRTQPAAKSLCHRPKTVFIGSITWTRGRREPQRVGGWSFEALRLRGGHQFAR